MATGLQTWSQTAATDATADSSVNWAEGQAPSSINDSARAMMAATAKWRDDINGSITTGGSSTAYTVTSNEIFAALTANYQITFVPHTTSGATVTLNVDSLGAKPLRSAPNVELPSGVLVQGTPYIATYYTSNSGEWILHDFYGNPYNIPVGGMMPYLSSTAPNSSFVLPYGQAISRTTYATLFALTSTTFGVGDGGTTFNLPDLRGRTISGLDNMGGSAASRLTSSYFGADATVIGNTGGSEKHTLSTAELPVITPSGTVTVAPNGALIATSQADINSIAAGGGAARAVAALTATFTGTPFGSGNAHVTVQPTMVLPWVLRVI